MRAELEQRAAGDRQRRDRCGGLQPTRTAPLRRQRLDSLHLARAECFGRVGARSAGRRQPERCYLDRRRARNEHWWRGNFACALRRAECGEHRLGSRSQSGWRQPALLSRRALLAYCHRRLARAGRDRRRMPLREQLGPNRGTQSAFAARSYGSPRRRGGGGAWHARRASCGSRRKRSGVLRGRRRRIDRGSRCSGRSDARARRGHLRAHLGWRRARGDGSGLCVVAQPIRIDGVSCRRNRLRRADDQRFAVPTGVELVIRGSGWSRRGTRRAIG